MLVTMLTRLAGPEGNAQPGTVLDLPKDKAEEFLNAKPFAFARHYNKELDDKPGRPPAPRGLTKAPENFQG